MNYDDGKRYLPLIQTEKSRPEYDYEDNYRASYSCTCYHGLCFYD